MNPKPRKLEWLEALRGFAALWVLFHHANQSAAYFFGWKAGSLERVLVNGFLGVDFFFVLSGFIIAFAAERLTDRGGTLLDYVKARVLRIYVPYLPLGIGMYFLYLALPGLSEAERVPGLVTSWTLLPSNHPPALSVAWTLVHELIFYFIFSVWFMSRRALWLILAVWAIAIIGSWALDLRLSRFAWYFLSPLNLCFLMGVLTYKLSRLISLGSLASGLVSVCGATLVLSQAIDASAERALVAIGFVLIVLGSTSPAAIRVRLWKPLLLLGAASYSIYLIHNPLLSLVARGAAFFELRGLPGFLVISSVAVIAGLVYWYLYEQPALRNVRQLISPRGASAVSVPAEEK